MIEATIPNNNLAINTGISSNKESLFVLAKQQEAELISLHDLIHSQINQGQEVAIAQTAEYVRCKKKNSQGELYNTVQFVRRPLSLTEANMQFGTLIHPNSNIYDVASTLNVSEIGYLRDLPRVQPYIEQIGLQAAAEDGNVSARDAMWLLRWYIKGEAYNNHSEEELNNPELANYYSTLNQLNNAVQCLQENHPDIYVEGMEALAQDVNGKLKELKYTRAALKFIGIGTITTAASLIGGTVASAAGANLDSTLITAALSGAASGIGTGLPVLRNPEKHPARTTKITPYKSLLEAAIEQERLNKSSNSEPLPPANTEAPETTTSLASGNSSAEISVAATESNLTANSPEVTPGKVHRITTSTGDLIIDDTYTLRLNNNGTINCIGEAGPVNLSDISKLTEYLERLGINLSPEFYRDINQYFDYAEEHNSARQQELPVNGLPQPPRTGLRGAVNTFFNRLFGRRR